VQGWSPGERIEKRHGAISQSVSTESALNGAERTVSDKLDGLNLTDPRRSTTLPRRSHAEYDSVRHQSEDRDLRFGMRLGQDANLAIGT
jgi:hypothetical protein